MLTNTPTANQYRRAMGKPEKQLLLAKLIRHADEFKGKLTPDDFAESDRGYALLWRLALEAAQKQGPHLDRALLKAGIEEGMQRARDALSSEEITDIDAIVAMAFDESEWSGEEDAGVSSIQRAMRSLKQYLAEVAFEQFQRSVRDGGQVATDLPGAFAEALDRVQAISAMHLGDCDILFPKGWDRDLDIGVFSTNIPFLDALLDGGHAPGEVYGLLGPYGSCKTTLAVMLACEGAKQASAALQAGGPHEYAFLVSYEAPAKELRLRILSYAAQVERKSLQAMGKNGRKTLSSSASLRVYEKELFHTALSAGKTVSGERERVERAVKWLNQHLIVLDFSGADPRHRDAGQGYVGEIVERIKAELRSRGKEARAHLVVVDYVGVMAKRHAMAQAKEMTAVRHLVSGVPLAAKFGIAGQFNCPVWLLHQLSGEANSRFSGSPCNHTDAAEAKNFGENLDFAVVIGPPNDAELRQIACTRHRRSSERPPLKVIRVRGALGRVEEVGTQFAVDVYAQTVGHAAPLNGVLGND